MKLSTIATLFALIAGVITVKAEPDSWVINADTIDSRNYYGITSANGRIGMVSSATPLAVSETVLGGVFDSWGSGRVSGLQTSINLLQTRLLINWEEVNQNTIANYHQQFDFRNGSLTGAFDFKDLATVTYTYRALRNMPNNVMLDVKVKAHKKATIVVENIHEVPQSMRDNRNYFNECNPPHAYVPLLSTVAQTPSGQVSVAASSGFMFGNKATAPKVVHEMRHSNSHLMQFTQPITEGDEYRFAVVGTLISSLETSDPYNQAERLTIHAALQSADKLILAHNAAWNKLWQSDITIEGNMQAQQDVHNMLYHLYAFTREGSSLPLSPMGLSGLGYMGHSFWDTETWMFPVLAVMHPELAKGLLHYRFERLDAARANARLHGYSGAMFPWESAMSGEEETPVWALSGPFEHHIVADVAIAAWQYYCITGDKQWLRTEGYPLLKETADFWVSRVEQEGEKYVIRNVVCADEWAENVDNDAYTNGAAKRNLEYATQATRILGTEADAQWSKVAARLKFSQLQNGVTAEHDSYAGENIKQADVNLLAYPLGLIDTKSQIKKDLEYYQSKVPPTGTPAMTQAVFALLSSRLGEPEAAQHWFSESYEPNLLPPFRVIAETRGGTNPYFITGAGGVLQSVIMGFAGIEISPKGIHQSPATLPSGWNSVKVTVADGAKVFVNQK